MVMGASERDSIFVPHLVTYHLGIAPVQRFGALRHVRAQLELYEACSRKFENI
jgi:hypothetical protein